MMGTYMGLSSVPFKVSLKTINYTSQHTSEAGENYHTHFTGE